MIPFPWSTNKNNQLPFPQSPSKLPQPKLLLCFGISDTLTFLFLKFIHSGSFSGIDSSVQEYQDHREESSCFQLWCRLPQCSTATWSSSDRDCPAQHLSPERLLRDWSCQIVVRHCWAWAKSGSHKRLIIVAVHQGDYRRLILDTEAILLPNFESLIRVRNTYDSLI